MNKKDWPLECRLKLDCISKEMLNYFGGCPQALTTGLSTDVGEASLSIGNGLVWVGAAFDPPGLELAPLGTRATTVQGLGKQFQAAGRMLMDGEENRLDGHIHNEINRLRLEVQSLKRLVLCGGVK